MKVLLLLFATIHMAYGRTVFSEGVISGIATTEKTAPLQLACTLRTLKSDEPYPSVIVKWKNEAQRFTWDATGEVKFERDYKHEVVSHSYPSSDGLPGNAPSKTPVDPFVNAPVIPDSYSWEDIVAWFQKDCSKPR